VLSSTVPLALRTLIFRSLCLCISFRRLNGALLVRELGVARAQHAVEECAEALLLQHAVSLYCPLAAGAKSTIAATYISGPSQPDLLATSQ
jgi:hypothetical protein